MPSSSAWSRMYVSSGHTMLNSPSGVISLTLYVAMARTRPRPASTPNSDRPAFCRAENPTLAFPWRRAKGAPRAAPGTATVAEAAAMETGAERGDGLRSAAEQVL
ncbi:hypothetical protein MUK42_36821 [Musa troglodytarum]|uniref:Uncharacterized protein n=1 Tax=Musa troglodytarum TaxID=320322 RepID=A0A9E7HPJ5_9LILI|nr:hypothetical protein MUK42_36821 [Musa troglodytarum]